MGRAADGMRNAQKKRERERRKENVAGVRNNTRAEIDFIYHLFPVWHLTFTSIVVITPVELLLSRIISSDRIMLWIDSAATNKWL
jgi:hypothetical protein